jgi:hypothetical protein
LGILSVFREWWKLSVTPSRRSPGEQYSEEKGSFPLCFWWFFIITFSRHKTSKRGKNTRERRRLPMSTQKAKEKEEEYFARVELEKKKKIIEQARGRLAEEEKQRLQELHYMHCPKCGSDLVEIPYKEIMIDKCPSCKGLWLDCGELEQVVTEEDKFLGGVLKIFK